MSVDDTPSLNSTIGVELVGFGLSLALYGIATGQAVAYFRRYGQLPLSPCIYLVTALWSIGTLHIVLIAYTMSVYLVLQRGNTAIFSEPPWTLGAIVILTVSSAFALVSPETDYGVAGDQCGYAYRIWRLSGKKWLVPCIIATSSVSSSAIGLAFAGKEVHLKSWTRGQDLGWMLYSGFSCQIATDTLIASAMFVLLRRFRTGLRRLDLVITMIVMYTVNTGILTILGTALCITFFVLRRTSFIYTGLYFALTKLCTCSFLGVLNAEQLLVRRAGSSSPTTTVPVLSTAMRVEPTATTQWEEDYVDVREVVASR
ncbi:hypothetical protein VTO73DRAFT_3501 [Trametes versicolor]